jgi:N-acetylneuraminic acid mutarotase
VKVTSNYKAIFILLCLIGYSRAQMTWTQATANAGWSKRAGHTSVVFDNKIWVIGGDEHSSSAYYNDVWHSSNGINWTQATANAGWQARTCLR